MFSKYWNRRLQIWLILLSAVIVPKFAFGNDLYCQRLLMRDGTEPLWETEANEIVSAALYHSRNYLERNDFTVTRSLKTYRKMLSGGRDALSSDLKALGASGHILDPGAGNVVALQDFLRSDQLTNLPSATAITFKAPAKIQQFNGRLRVLSGRLFEEIPNAEIGMANLILDVYGAILYSAAPDLVLQKYASLLQPNGSIYLVVGTSFDKKTLTPDNLILIKMPNKEVMYLHDWIKEYVRGFDVEILVSSYNENGQSGEVYGVRLTKNGDPIQIPKLELIDVDDTNPPYLTRWFGPATNDVTSKLASTRVKKNRASEPRLAIPNKGNVVVSKRQLSEVLTSMNRQKTPFDKTRTGVELLGKCTDLSDLQTLKKVVSAIFDLPDANQNQWFENERWAAELLAKGLKQRLTLDQLAIFVSGPNFYDNRGMMTWYLTDLVQDFSDTTVIAQIFEALENISLKDQLNSQAEQLRFNDSNVESNFIKKLVQNIESLSPPSYVHIIKSIRYYNNIMLAATELLNKVQGSTQFVSKADVAFLKPIFSHILDENDKVNSIDREYRFEKLLTKRIQSPEALEAVISYMNWAGSAEDLAVSAAPYLSVDLENIDALVGVFDELPVSAGPAFQRALSYNENLTIAPRQIYIRSKNYRPPPPASQHPSVGMMLSW